MAITGILPPITTATACTIDKQLTTANTGLPKIYHIGCNALKNSAGYNLPALLAGLEGTLGVITNATIKLYPIPAHVIAASCAFLDLYLAANAVATLQMTGIPVSRIELLDEMSIQAFNHSLSIEDGVCNNGRELHLQLMDVTLALFLKFASHSQATTLEDLAAAQNICISDFGGLQFALLSDETTRKSLWTAGH
jgi:D-lactate dehydrogenase (cytochrome)